MKSLCKVMFAVCAAGLALCASIAAQERVRRADATGAEKVRRQELEAISTIVKGVCVDGVSGEPLAGVQVRCDAWDRGAKDAPAELSKPEPVTTGSDGAFAVRVLARPKAQVGFEAAMPGRWPRTGRWNYLLPGVVEDLGKVRLHPGVHAVGKVVNEAGEPVPEAVVIIERLKLFVGSEQAAGRPLPPAKAVGELGRASHWAANGSRSCRSDAKGAFASRVALPPGTFPLRLLQSRFELVEPQQITIPDPEQMQQGSKPSAKMPPVTIVVREQPFLSGKVVDEQGQPVARVVLEAKFRRPGAGRIASGRSKQDGSFRIYRVDGAPDRVGLFLVDPGPCERRTLGKQYAWGQRDITIELQRALQVEVRVVAADTGQPIEDYQVRVHQPEARGRPARQGTLAKGRHADGRATVARVPRGKCSIVIVPKDPKLPVTAQDVVASDELGPVTITVPRLVPLMVQVQDGSGQPVKNATVLVIEPGGEGRELLGSERVYDPRLGVEGARGKARLPGSWVWLDTQIYRAATDAAGQCLVYGISGRRDLQLGVRVGGAKLTRVDDVAFGPEGGTHVVTLK